MESIVFNDAYEPSYMNNGMLIPINVYGLKTDIIIE